MIPILLFHPCILLTFRLDPVMLSRLLGSVVLRQVLQCWSLNLSQPCFPSILWVAVWSDACSAVFFHCRHPSDSRLSVHAADDLSPDIHCLRAVLISPGLALPIPVTTVRLRRPGFPPSGFYSSGSARPAFLSRPRPLVPLLSFHAVLSSPALTPAIKASITRSIVSLPRSGRP